MRLFGGARRRPRHRRAVQWHNWPFVDRRVQERVVWTSLDTSSRYSLVANDQLRDDNVAYIGDVLHRLKSMHAELLVASTGRAGSSIVLRSCPMRFSACKTSLSPCQL